MDVVCAETPTTPSDRRVGGNLIPTSPIHQQLWPEERMA
jgi:hypothetical protein